MSETVPATPTFLGIPREIRDHIYELVWCSPGYARLTQEYIQRQMTDPYECGDRVTFPEAVAFPYPPKKPTEESGSESEDEYDSEDEEEGKYDYLSASGEGEDEILERAAALAPLDTLNDDEDSTDQEDLEESDEEEYGYGYGEDEADSLILVTPVHTELLLVNKQISEEALPVLYNNTTLVLDADGFSCMQFIKKLPRATRRRIVSMAITNSALMGDDGPSRRAWSGSVEKPLYRGADGLTLVTPFAATLAKDLPNLQVFSLYVPWSGDNEWYCTYATLELSMMLKYGRIVQLNHVFFGETVAKALQLDSFECYEELMGALASGEKLAQHEFDLQDPHPPGPYSRESRKKGQQRLRREDKYLREHAESFSWSWEDRNIDMGCCGNVQAVVACWSDAVFDDA